MLDTYVISKIMGSYSPTFPFSSTIRTCLLLTVPTLWYREEKGEKTRPKNVGLCRIVTRDRTESSMKTRETGNGYKRGKPMQFSMTRDCTLLSYSRYSNSQHHKKNNGWVINLENTK